MKQMTTMAIKRIHIENFRGFSDITIDFSTGVTCIAGINGAGKTSILDALAIVLSWIRGMLLPEPQNGEYVKTTDKKKDAAFSAQIAADFEILGIVKQIDVGVDTTPGLTIKFANKAEMMELYEVLQRYYSPNHLQNNLPVIAYYPVNRSDLNINVSVEAARDFSDIYEIYSNCLKPTIQYKDFFQWFRDREDRENAEMVLRFKNKQAESGYEDKQLKAVRSAIKHLLPAFDEMTVDRKRMTICVNKNTETLDFNSLSDGEKGLITLFGDIARRLAIANDNMENPLEGNGIILIDEVELHLHPSWQRKICNALKATFPNCQFIITTHSPQILGELQANEIWLLNHFQTYKPDISFGLTSNEILDEIMDIIDDNTVLSRNEQIAKQLSELSRLIECEEIEAAKQLVQSIEQQTGEIHEIRKYKHIIALEENEG